MISLPFAPLVVTLRESGLTDQVDALAVPKGYDEGVPRTRVTTKELFRAL